MELTINRKSLLSAARQATLAVPRKHGWGKPILKSLLLTAVTDCVFVTGTDLEVAIQVRIGISPECVVPTEPIAQSCLLSPRAIGVLEADTSETILLIWGDHHVSVRTDTTSFDEGTLLPGEFPSMAAPKDPAWSADIPGMLLSAALSRVLLTVGVSEQWTIDAVCFCKSDGDLTAVVATNGRRLLCQELSITPPESNVLVPGHVSKLVTQLFSGDGLVRIEADENTIAFESHDTLFVARLREGRFPKWQKHMPARRNGCAEVQASLLASRTKQLAAAACEIEYGDTPRLKLVIGSEGIGMSLERSRTDAKTSIPVVSEHLGEACFFSDVLLPAFTALSPETVVTLSMEGDVLFLRTDDGWRAIIYRVTRRNEK